MIEERLSIISWVEGRPCPRCNKSETVRENGQFICSGCGAVLKEELEPETITRARTNSKAIASKLDRLSQRTFIGKSGAMAMKLTTIPLQRLDYNIKKGGEFNDYLIRMADYVDKLGLGTTVYEEAYGILIRARDRVLVRRYELATAASIYLACRKLGISRSLEDICRVLPQVQSLEGVEGLSKIVRRAERETAVRESWWTIGGDRCESRGTGIGNSDRAQDDAGFRRKSVVHRIDTEGFLRWTTLRGSEGAQLQIANARHLQSVQRQPRNN